MTMPDQTIAIINYVTMLVMDICTDIDSFVEEQHKEQSSLDSDVICTACEMAVVWIENQLRMNKTRERILAYANEAVYNLNSHNLRERLLSPNGEATGNCDQIASMPDIAFPIANKSFTLTPEQYILNLDEQGTAVCISGFMAFDVPPPRGPLWILGDAVMAVYHTVFDFGDNKIGFAKSA